MSDMENASNKAIATIIPTMMAKSRITPPSVERGSLGLIPPSLGDS